MLAIVTGLTGVGKSTVIDHARDMDSCPEFSVKNYGDILLELAQEQGLAENRDKLTEIPPSKYDDLQEAVPWTINDMSSDERVVLDTHATLKTPTGYRPGLPKETIDVLEPDNMAFIKAPAKVIRERRLSDESRDRAVDPLARLREQQKMGIRMASANAVQAGCPLCRLRIRMGVLMQLLKTLRRF